MIGEIIAVELVEMGNKSRCYGKFKEYGMVKIRIPFNTGIELVEKLFSFHEKHSRQLSEKSLFVTIKFSS